MKLAGKVIDMILERIDNIELRVLLELAQKLECTGLNSVCV